MFAVNTYEEIVKREKESEDKHIVVLLFVKPSLPGASDIINEFDYIHYNSDKYCSIYAVGYTDDFINANSKKGYVKVRGVDGNDWYFSDREFVKFKNNLENRLQWTYSGEIEAMVLQNNPYAKNSLNFQNYVAIDVNYGIRNGYSESFPRFMESLVRASKNEVTAYEAICNVAKCRVKIKEVIEDVIDDCKKIPKPLKRIFKDQLFYRSSIRISKKKDKIINFFVRNSYE